VGAIACFLRKVVFHPAHVARLLKLAADCAGFRSSRERINSALISN
jgi:hypothetical protein